MSPYYQIKAGKWEGFILDILDHKHCNKTCYALPGVCFADVGAATTHRRRALSREGFVAAGVISSDFQTAAHIMIHPKAKTP